MHFGWLLARRRLGSVGAVSRAADRRLDLRGQLHFQPRDEDPAQGGQARAPPHSDLTGKRRRPQCDAYARRPPGGPQQTDPLLAEIQKFLKQTSQGKAAPVRPQSPGSKPVRVEPVGRPSQPAGRRARRAAARFPGGPAFGYRRSRRPARPI